MLALAKPISLAARTVVLLPDEYAVKPRISNSILLEPASVQRPACWLRQDALEDARSRFPGAAVYGFWQTLLANGIASTARALHVFPLEEEGAGLYLFCDGGKVVSSGRYVGNRLQADIPVPFESARHVRPSATSIQLLPDACARLPAEIEAARRAQSRARVLRLTAGFTTIGVFAIAANWGLQQLAERRATEIAEFDVRTASYRQDRLLVLASRMDPALDLRRQAETLAWLRGVVETARLMQIPETPLAAVRWNMRAARMAQIPQKIDLLTPAPDDSVGLAGGR